MLNFNEFERTEEATIYFIPYTLVMEMGGFLTRRCNNNIVKKCYGKNKIKANAELTKKRHEAFVKEVDFWKNSQYKKFPEEQFGAIEMYVSSEDAYKIIKSFFEDSEDEGVKKYRAMFSPDLRVTYSDQSEMLPIELPLDGHKIRAIGSRKQVEKLKDLLEKRKLSQKDVELILRTVKFKN